MHPLIRGCLALAFYVAAFVAAIVGALLVTSIFYIGLQIAFCC